MWFESFPMQDANPAVAITENGYPTSKGLGYEFDDDLTAAIDIALGLGRPLLVSGEPGCGKTELGFAIARRLNIPNVHFYSVKSTSEARDLFYTYDAIGRFREAQIRQFAVEGKGGDSLKEVGDYIEFQALGRAILDAHLPENVVHLTKPANYRHPGTATRSVVIIDEVDKAPRDFPNDLLRDIEDLTFRVPELAQSMEGPVGGPIPQPETLAATKIEEGKRPILIITSNEERQLPDAFLRRCIFHNIQFPNGRRLANIIDNALARRAGLTLGNEDRDELIKKLEALRKKPMLKKPGTSEAIDAATLMAERAGDAKLSVEKRLARTGSALVKVKDDRKAFDDVFAGGKESA